MISDKIWKLSVSQAKGHVIKKEHDHFLTFSVAFLTLHLGSQGSIRVSVHLLFNERYRGFPRVLRCFLVFLGRQF